MFDAASYAAADEPAPIFSMIALANSAVLALPPRSLVIDLAFLKDLE